MLDDHPVVRQGIRKILDGEPDISLEGEAATFAELLGLFDAKKPDVVILDITLPGSSGLDVLKELKTQYPGIPVLILTIHKEEHFALRTLKAGAEGFLNKMSVSDELVQALRKVAGGGKYINPRVADLLAMEINDLSSGILHESLSDREFQVLCLLGAGKSVSEIGQELRLSVKTISTYRQRLLEKLEMKTTAELMHYAIQRKLVS